MVPGIQLRLQESKFSENPKGGFHSYENHFEKCIIELNNLQEETSESKKKYLFISNI